ncbi:MAG: hypothetical protein FJ147_19435 [Deltaproteobacteria bacterium]|nr:hypothetical protein [Deltaproteobacteria bacterium]
MSTPTSTQLTLGELFAQLEAAVRAGDRAGAMQLEQTILQRLASDAADRANLERRLRALMAELDQPTTKAEIKSLDPFDLERGGLEPDADGVVYPVWFGTNRKPTAQGDGFTEPEDIQACLLLAHRAMTGEHVYERIMVVKAP